MTHRRPVIAVHGGAGSRLMTPEQCACVAASLDAGLEVLRRRGTALLAVERAIRVLEASGLFNAGVGSRLQLDSVRRMDASIMEGTDLRAGAVAALEGIRHPITAARLVMERTDHVLLVGPPAGRFARFCRLERLRKPSPNELRKELVRQRPRKGKSMALFHRMAERERKFGTVGAVALDEHGTVAAGASTGGVAIMLPGRVGDSPLIGCGVYADNQGGAVSMTGIGESIIRVAAAKEIVDRLHQGVTPQHAAKEVLRKLVTRTKGEAGLLAVDVRGRVSIRHTTDRMAAGYWTGMGQPVVRDRF